MLSKIPKKLLFIFTMIVLCFSLSLVANAQTYSGTCGVDGDNLTWTLDTNTGVLGISGEGAMKNYDGTSPWFKYRESIKYIEIHDGVTSLGNNAFEFTKCEDIEIPKSVESIGSLSVFGTSLKNITVADENNFFASINGVLFNKDKTTLIKYPSSKPGNYYSVPNSVKTISREAFSYSQLSHITIPESVTYISVHAFLSCEKLSTVDLSTGLKSIDNGAFAACQSLTNIMIPSTVYYISNQTFANCKNLKEINVSDDNSTYSSIDGIVYSKDQIKLLMYPTGKQELEFIVPDKTVVIGSYAFKDANLEVVKLSDNLETIQSYAFEYCENLKVADLPSSLKNVEKYAFNSCQNLQKVVLPKGIERIGIGAFSSCYKITSLNIPDNAIVEIAAFSSCKSLQTVTIGSSVVFYEKEGLAGVGVFENCDSLTTITVGENVTKIPVCFAYSCDNLTKVVLPDSITEIKSDAFGSCNKFNLYYLSSRNNWTKIYFSGIVDAFCGSDPTIYYLEQGYTFRIDETVINDKAYFGSIIVDCETSISGDNVLPASLGGYKVTTLEGAVFSGCNKLTGIEIHENVISISYSAFNNCSSLKKIEIDENNPHYSSIDGVFFDKTCETLIKYPQAKSTLRYAIPEGVVTIYSGAMNSCVNLRNVEIPASVANIATPIFSSCDSLRNIIVSDNNFSFYSVDGVLFDALTNTLIKYPAGKTETTYTIPNGTEIISSQAFYPCTKITHLNIPDSLLKINSFAFSGKNLFSKGSVTSITYDGSPDSWKCINISSGNTCITSATLTCLKENHDSSYITVEYKEWNDLSTDTDSYILDHYIFYESGKTDFLEQYKSFYSTVWEKENENDKRWFASVTWKVLGDLGEVMTFKFNDLTINASYYDLFVADLVLAMNNVTKTDKFSVAEAKVYKKYYSSVKNLLKTTEEWEKATADGLVLDVEVEGFLTKPGYKLSKNTSAILEKVLGSVFTKHKGTFTKIFNLTDSASQMCSYVSTGADIVNAFKKAYDTYIIVETFKTLDEDFYDICDLIAYQLYQENVNWGNEFLKSVNKYKSQASNDAALFSSLLKCNTEMLNVAYELTLKDVLKNASYTLVAKMLNCSTASLNFVTASYNLTYAILDSALKLGSKTDFYSLMHYAAPVEKALRTITKNKGILLKSDFLYNKDNSYNSAKIFDLSYNMWRCTNMYLYECAYNFLAAQKIYDEMSLATQYKAYWNNFKCHKGLATVTSSKIVTVNCPVDVFVYDANKDIVLAIENEIVTQKSDNISVMIADGKKMFSYPANEEYFIDIKARENGTMEYYITEVQDDAVIRTIEFYDLELTPDCVYSGSIPYELGMDSIEYQLVKNQKEVLSDYDNLTTTDCETNGHSFDDWYFVTSLNADELDYEQRVCSVCGKVDKRTIHSEHTVLLLGNIKTATCSEQGYSGDTYCALCGEITNEGSITPKEEHQYEVTYTPPTCIEKGSNRYHCTVCGSFYDEELSPLGHTEITIKGHAPTCTDTGLTDGVKCGICNETLTAQQTIGQLVHKDDNEDYRCDYGCGHKFEKPAEPDTPDEPIDDTCDHLCHKSGFMGFIWKIVRFFWKLFRMNPVCECGVAHY